MSVIGVITIILVILFILAIIWEYQDHHRISNRPFVDLSLLSPELQREIRFYGCFNAENKITWRTLFFGSILVVVVIWIFLSINSLPFPPIWALTLFLTTFLIFYGIDQFQTFHLYRPMCAKINPSREII